MDTQFPFAYETHTVLPYYTGGGGRDSFDHDRLRSRFAIREYGLSFPLRIARIADTVYAVNFTLFAAFRMVHSNVGVNRETAGSITIW